MADVHVVEKNFNRISRANIVTSGTRNIPKAWSTSKKFNRISRANIVTNATRNISKRWSISKNFNRISRANIVTRGTRNISKAWSTSKNFQSHFSRKYRDRGTRNMSKAWSTSKNFTRNSRANIVTRGTRNISKAWSTSKISIAFLAPISWLAALATSPKLGRLEKTFNRISRTNIVTSGTRNISKAWSTWKLSIAFLAPISWPAALASPSMVVQFFQSHIRLLKIAPAIEKMYGDKWY